MNKTTLEALKLAEEALVKANRFHDYEDELAAIREVLAAPEITTPDVCGEVCAQAKLCYGCGKALDEANAKLAEPVKQEPVAWGNLDDGCKDGHRFLTKDKAAAKKYHEQCYDLTELYAAPVDAKAIRAEALEEAAKWLAESGLIGSNDCAAAIRSLCSKDEQRGLK